MVRRAPAVLTGSHGQQVPADAVMVDIRPLLAVMAEHRETIEHVRQLVATDFRSGYGVRAMSAALLAIDDCVQGLVGGDPGAAT